MEAPQYDPRTKQQIKEELYKHLYSPVERSLKKRLENIIYLNRIAGGYTNNSFYYKGEIYTTEPGVKTVKWNKLVLKLKPEMDSFLAEKKRVEDEEAPYVMGFINYVLNSSNDLHDYLKLLPESVHAPIMNIINQCPCRHKNLSPQKIVEIQKENQLAISLMKQRQAINLLI